jgi:hypothetical protein
MSGRRSRTAPLLALVVGVGLLTACGGDGTDSSATTTGVVDTGSDDGGGGEIAVLTAQEVCDIVTAAIVGEALGLDITGAEAADSGSTPQCAYAFDSDGGGTSNVTVASMDATALGGRTGDAAFDYVAEVNREVAGGADVQEVEVDAGDRALRFTGEAIHLGIVAVDGHLQTVIVPLDVDGDAVDTLLVAVATAIAA